MRRPVADDRGSIAPLVLVYAVVAMVLVGVVADSSQAFLYRRALAAAADGAAVTAAGSLDEPAFYSGGAAGADLPVGDVAAAVELYVERARLRERFPGVAVTEVTTDGAQVHVVLSARVDLRFDPLGLHDALVDASATARSPYAP